MAGTGACSCFSIYYHEASPAPAIAPTLHTQHVVDDAESNSRIGLDTLSTVAATLTIITRTSSRLWNHQSTSQFASYRNVQTRPIPDQYFLFWNIELPL